MSTLLKINGMAGIAKIRDPAEDLKLNKTVENRLPTYLNYVPLK